MHVAALLPDAKYLRIGVLRPNLLSRGTFRSALGLANSRVSIRRNGRLISVPVGRLQRSFDYGDGERESVAVNWADVFTAYYSTGIRNIEAYFEADIASRIPLPDRRRHRRCHAVRAGSAFARRRRRRMA